VTVGHTDLHDLTSSELTLIPSAERDREFGSARRRQQYLCGRSLLRRMLQDRTGEPAISHQLTTTESGKPVCIDGPAISITHAGDRVACGVAEDGDIGIDIELMAEQRDISRITRKFFSEEESSWLETQTKDRFFMLWVLKEAYVKATGRSIFGGINRLRCKVEPPHIDIISMSDRMRSLCLYVTDDSMLALAATETSLATVEFERWDTDTERLTSSNEYRLLATTRETEN
jgi:phosphopantetheine--protein transferase-like protein